MVSASALSVPFALFVYCLELLVALIQAYVFTMLSSLFIGLCLHPSH
jgi:F-type H+-transporting ATPase subunit a